MKVNEWVAKAGDVLIGPGHPIVVQTMCNTHTADVDASFEQCVRLWEAGAEMIRLTVPGPAEVQAIREIRSRLRGRGIPVPLVADIHFSAQTALAVAPFVEKVRINPGNFHRDHAEARKLFGSFLEICREHGTAVRIGINHGSLGSYITDLYGNTPEGMAKAALEWLDMCIEADFHNVVVSLKSSNTVVLTEAYRRLAELMDQRGHRFPLHVGLTESGNGDSGRIKSCVGISTLLAEGLGDTVRVSLTEDPAAELPVARYLADRYRGSLRSSLVSFKVVDRNVDARYEAPSRERLLMDVSCDFGKRLLEGSVDGLTLSGTYTDESGANVSIADSGLGEYLVDELMQAARRRFYKPEYIACPGCGRTMYDLQGALEEVKARTSHLKNVVIAVMGCIVNGPGEMADADWGYVGEGGGKVSIYRGKNALLRHVPEREAADKLLELIEKEQAESAR